MNEAYATLVHGREICPKHIDTTHEKKNDKNTERQPRKYQQNFNIRNFDFLTFESPFARQLLKT